jgi:Ca2+-binding RTX toxin-like protein
MQLGFSRRDMHRNWLLRLLTVSGVIALSVVGMSTGRAGTPTCFGMPATIVGTDFSDSLEGTDGDDVIVGLGGDDYIFGYGGKDLLCGGTGADTMQGTMVTMSSTVVRVEIP